MNEVKPRSLLKTNFFAKFLLFCTFFAEFSKISQFFLFYKWNQLNLLINCLKRQRMVPVFLSNSFQHYFKYKTRDEDKDKKSKICRKCNKQIFREDGNTKRLKEMPNKNCSCITFDQNMHNFYKLLLCFIDCQFFS